MAGTKCWGVYHSRSTELEFGGRIRYQRRAERFGFNTGCTGVSGQC